MAPLDTKGLNESFDLLTHPHRRYVLYYLTKESEVVDVDTVATAISKWDGNHVRTDRTNDSKDIETALHHTHLPKLAAAGIITFDGNTGSIELRETNGLSRFLVGTARIDGYAQTGADD